MARGAAVTDTKTRLPQVGDDVTLAAWCQGCGAALGRWRFVWDGEPRDLKSHTCVGSEQGILVQMDWLHNDEARWRASGRTEPSPH